MTKTTYSHGRLVSGVAVTGLALALAGCFGGGGGGDASNRDGGSGGDDNSELMTFETVEATTEYTSDGGMSFSEATNADTTSNSGASSSDTVTASAFTSFDKRSVDAACGDNPSDRYLETSEAIVFGDGNASDEQLQRLANAIHHYYPKTLEAFGLDQGEFDTTNRAGIAYRFLRGWIQNDVGFEGSITSLGHIENALGSETSFTATVTNATQAMSELMKLNSTELKAVIDEAFADAEEDNTAELLISKADLMSVESTVRGTHQPRYTDEAKIVACADTSTDPGNGTADIWGITVAGDFKGEIVHHELVHYVQERLFGGRTVLDQVPRWFREGQAVVMADQPMVGESRVDELNPVTIETYQDEDESVTSLDNYYGFYGLAYSYVADGTPQEDMNRVLTESFVSPEQVTNNGGDEAYKTKAQFDDLVLKPDSSDLTYSEYQNNWEPLVRDHL